MNTSGSQDLARDSIMATAGPRAKTRVAIVVSHPIQHFTPLYRELAARPELHPKVFFCSRAGLEPYRDPGFGIEFRWDADLLSGYESEFLPNAERVTKMNFWTLHSSALPDRLEAFQPHVVQVYGYAQRIALQALLWCKRRRVPTLMMSDSELVHRRSAHVRAVKRLLLPNVYRLVDGFLTIGDNNERYLEHYGVHRSKMFRSPYPTNDSHFLATLQRSPEVRRETRARLGISESAFVAVFVGKLIDRKRPADLVAAVRLACSRSKRELVALIVGDGALRAELENDMRKHGPQCVRFAGFVNQAELPAMYAAADVVAHPADNDPHPIAVTEGVLMGLPAVVSDRIGSVGPTDTVRAGENGIVFGTGNVDAFAGALEKLAGDSQLRTQMGQASRRIATEMGMSASVSGYVAAVRASSQQ